MSKSIGRFFSGLYQVGAVKRTIIIWLLLQAVLWVFFVIGYLARPGAWQDVPAIAPASAAVGGVASTLGYIVFRNAIVLLLIGAGNILVRFGSVTPGLLVLLVQGATIGWVERMALRFPFQACSCQPAVFTHRPMETSAYAVLRTDSTKSLLLPTVFLPGVGGKAYPQFPEVFPCRKDTRPVDTAFPCWSGLSGGTIPGEVIQASPA